MKGFRVFTVLLGFVVFVTMGTVLFMTGFLPLKERLIVLGIALIVNLLLMLGVINLRRGGAFMTTLLLLVVILAEGSASYLVWSSLSALDTVVDKGKTGQTEGADTAPDWTKSFHILLSGKDVAGDLDKESRSDVNMVLTVNPKTHTIEATTIPRDSYMRIADQGQDEYDKLTHSGFYSIDSTIHTLERFFEVDFEYYAEVNFTSVIEIVDLLGGVDVDNAIQFSAGGKTFDQGKIHLNGKEALIFARERHSFRDAEMERGRNHVRLLKAMIEKAMSPAILTSYPNILNVVTEKMRTNMTRDMMVALLNDQIANNVPWTVKSSQLLGFETKGLPSHALPNMSLYMFLPSQASKRDIRDLMAAVFAGTQVPTLPDSYTLAEEDYRDLPVDGFRRFLQNEPDQLQYDRLQEQTDGEG